MALFPLCCPPSIAGNTTLSPAYEAATETNANILGWGEDVLTYSDLVAVYHTGWDGPASPQGTYTVALGDGILSSMDDDLLMSVKLLPPNGSAPTWPMKAPRPLDASRLTNAASLSEWDYTWLNGAVPDGVSVVVDKRIAYGQQPPAPARQVNLTFGPLISAVEVVTIDAAAIAAGRQRRVNGDPTWADDSRSSYLFLAPSASAGVTVNLTLVGGGGAFLRLYASSSPAFVAAARFYRPWRYTQNSADWSALRTTQYPFYNYYFQTFPSTTLPLGIVDLDATASVVAADYVAKANRADQGAAVVKVISADGSASNEPETLANRLASWLAPHVPPSMRSGSGSSLSAPRKQRGAGCSRPSIDGGIAGRLALGDSAAVMRVLSSVGFNAYVTPATLGANGGANDTFYNLLNAAMNNGANLLASPPVSSLSQQQQMPHLGGFAAHEAQSSARSLRSKPRSAEEDEEVTASAEAASAIWTPGQVQQALTQYACHPNLGGLWLVNSPLDATNCTSALPAAQAVRYGGSHLFAPAAAGNAAAAASLAQQGVPLSPLFVPGAAGWSALVLEYAGMSLIVSNPALTSSYSSWVLIDACADGFPESAASLTFRATLALAYGARGLWWTGVARCAASADPTLLDSLALLAQQLAGPPGWGQQILTSRVSALYASDPSKLPGSVAPGPGQLVAGLGPDVIAAVFTQPTSANAPPLILLVEASCVTSASGCMTGTAPRIATATLDASIVGWGVVEGDQTAGFPSCGKTTVGNDVSLQLLPGGAELLQLVQLKQE